MVIWTLRNGYCTFQWQKICMDRNQMLEQPPNVKVCLIKSKPVPSVWNNFKMSPEAVAPLIRHWNYLDFEVRPDYCICCMFIPKMHQVALLFVLHCDKALLYLNTGQDTKNCIISDSISPLMYPLKIQSIKINENRENFK